MKEVKLGTIVQIEARGSRGQESEADIVPAMVLKQWPDGSLSLFVFHFGGSNYYVHSIRPEEVEILTEPNARSVASSNALAAKFAFKA